MASETATGAYSLELTEWDTPKYDPFTSDIAAACKDHDAAAVRSAFGRFHATWYTLNDKARYDAQRAKWLHASLDAVESAFKSVLDEWFGKESPEGKGEGAYPRELGGLGSPKYNAFVGDMNAALKAHDIAAVRAVLRKFRMTWYTRQAKSRDDAHRADDMEDALDAFDVVIESALYERPGNVYSLHGLATVE